MSTAEIPAWVDDALCAQIDVGEAWFPEQGTNANGAIRLCQRCPVKDACLQYALEYERNGGVAYGIYGGMTPSARTKLIRQSDRLCRGCKVTIPRGTRSAPKPHYCDECRYTRHREQQAAYNAGRSPR